MKAAIFDFDGTLADTLPLCFHSFNRVFYHFDQKDFTSDEIKEMFGPPETDIIRNQLKSDDHEDAIEMYYEEYMSKHSDFVQFHEELHHLLTQLKREGIKLGIVTGKSRRSLKISMDELRMNEFFDITITGDEVENPKPHPEGVIQALRDLNIKKEDAVFLGDSDADIEAGKRAGLYTIGVKWLPNTQVTEFAVKPDHVMQDVNEFMNLDLLQKK
ncbi:HAD family hydrolase [Pseudalkalibacillus sp. SCS-8]|uniref:HAD family hydrolase n=1 Tax=Pseudalkalibacillus nanhaiensis TaxID=3115291 RepID=UPI0032DBA5A5